MSLIVQKFGGSSVANAERVMNVARIVTDTYKAGNDVVVVVSAQGDTTDDLIEKAQEINPKASKREMSCSKLTIETIIGLIVLYKFVNTKSVNDWIKYTSFLISSVNNIE